MANSSISGLPTATVPLVGNELIEVVYAGDNYKVTRNDFFLNAPVNVIAENVTFTPVGDIEADTVADAIAELDSEKAPIVHGHVADDITDFASVVRGVVGSMAQNGVHTLVEYDSELGTLQWDVDLPIASQAVAEAATDDELVMTPLKVKQSILANSPSGAPHALGDHTNVDTETAEPVTGDRLGFDGENWVPVTDPTLELSDGAYLKGTGSTPVARTREETQQDLNIDRVAVSFSLPTATDGDYVLVFKMPFPGTIEDIDYQITNGATTNITIMKNWFSIPNGLDVALDGSGTIASGEGVAVDDAVSINLASTVGTGAIHLSFNITRG